MRGGLIVLGLLIIATMGVITFFSFYGDYNTNYYNTNITIKDKTIYPGHATMYIEDVTGTFYSTQSNFVFNEVKINHTYSVKIKEYEWSGILELDKVNCEV